MANLRHPYDVELENLAFMRRDLERDFLEDDGVIDKTERGILIQFSSSVDRMFRARGLERGIELLMKQDARPTKYTLDLFEDVGIRLEPLDAA